MKHMLKCSHALAVGVGIVFGLMMTMPMATAADDGIQINGFASFYGTKQFNDTGYVDYGTSNFDEFNKNWNFSNRTKLGLNVRADFSEEFAAVAQILAGNEEVSYYRGPRWYLRADWAFLQYRPVNSVYLRLGRQLAPFWLSSEYIDVGLVTPWIRMPYHVFMTSVLKSFEGGSAEYIANLPARLRLASRLYGGNVKVDFMNSGREFNGAGLIYGGTFTLTGSGFTVRAGVTRYKASINIDTSAILSSGAVNKASPYGAGVPLGSGVGALGLPYIIQMDMPNWGTIYSGGFKFDKYNVFAQAETMFASSTGGTDYAIASKNPLTGVSAGSGIWFRSTRGSMATLGYHLWDFFPHYTYGKSEWRMGMVEGVMTSHTAGLNYQMSPNVVLKGEYMTMTSKDGRGFLSTDTTATGAPAFKGVSIGADIVF